MSATAVSSRAAAVAVDSQAVLALRQVVFAVGAHVGLELLVANGGF